MPVVIGVTGLKSAGKSEVRKHLVMRYGFTPIPFAEPLKAMLKAMGLSEEQLNGSLKETPCSLLRGQTPRHAMQTLGTEWGRMMIADDLWLNLWRQKVLACRTPVICDDLRFENEFDEIRALGGKILRVTRPGLQESKHVSETAASALEVDYGITNNKRILDLQSSVDKAVQYFGFRRQSV